MAQPDQPSLQSIAAIPEPLARIGALAKWITVRMDDLKALESRLDKRAEHLGKTEENLRKLFEALRSEVSAAHPLIGQLSALREGTAGAVLQHKPPMGDAPSPKAADIENRLNDLVKQADATILKRIQGFDEDLSVTIDTAKSYLSSAAESTRADAESITESLSHKLELAEKVAADLCKRIDDRMQEGVDRAYGAIDVLCEPLQRKIADKFEEFEKRIQTAMTDVQQDAINRVAALNRKLEEMSIRMDQRMESVADDFNRRAELTIQASKQQIRRQIDEMSGEIRTMAQPVIQMLEQRRSAVDLAAHATMQNVEDSLQLRLEELRKAGEGSVQNIESQLIEKQQAMRAQAQASVGVIEKQFAQRLDLAIETARQAIELTEQQLMDRIAELRPRATAAAMAAHKELTGQLASLEAEATTATSGIAERLSQRIDELTYHARRSIAEEIRALDEAAQKLRKHEKVMTNALNDGSVEVQIRVDQPDTKPAAA